MIAVKTTNWSAILAALFNDHPLNWEPIEGPQSGVGSDLHFENPVAKGTALVNQVDTRIVIFVNAELVWQGEEEELLSILPKPYNRLSAKLEDLQDTSKLKACILSQAEVTAALHTFEKFDIETELQTLTDPKLYTLDLATDSGGTYQELRTSEEILYILEKEGHLTTEEALKAFRTWTETGESPQKVKGCEIHLDEVSVENSNEEKLFGDVIEDPDMVGQSSYRAAADLAAQVSEETSDASDVEKHTILDQEKLEAIDTEMSELVSSALTISEKTKSNTITP